MEAQATIPTTFGKRLRMIREERGLTQEQLRDAMERACDVRIGQTYVSELERTDKAPGLEVAAAMAEVLGVSLDYFGLLINEPVSFMRDADSQTSEFA